MTARKPSARRRRTPIPQLPPPPSVTPPRTLPTTREQRADRRNQVEFMLLNGDGEHTVFRECRERFGIGPKAATKLMDEVRDLWIEEGEANRRVSKQLQLKRLHQELRLAKSATRVDENGRTWPAPERWKWHAVAQLETLIAKIQGNFAPVKVEATGQLNHALFAVVSGLSDERRVDMIARQRALRLAAASTGYVPENDVAQAPPRTGPR